MKRVKAACILQTLVFAQREGCGLSKERQIADNKREVEDYKKNLERAGTKHQIVDEVQQEDGSIVVHVRKQYNNTTSAAEYFK